MRRKAFSLVELLVAVAIVVLMMALMSAALSAARTRGKKDQTQATILAISEIVQRHFSATESSAVGAAVPTSARGAAIRRQITADMPDSWAEVRTMQSDTATYSSARHRGYVDTLARLNPTDQYGSAECLFMIIMQGGLADCLSCASLDSVPKDDLDGDGAPEFLDAWGQPIKYVLWPAGFEQPLSTKYFDQTPPFDGLPPAGAAGGTMRPLIFSLGGSDPAKECITANKDSYLALGNACGDPAGGAIATLGGLLSTATDDIRDVYLTNFSDEVAK
jgi:prepilin-type N-terminal cleavage/methylation domain-containing protein